MNNSPIKYSKNNYKSHDLVQDIPTVKPPLDEENKATLNNSSKHSLRSLTPLHRGGSAIVNNMK